MNILFDQQGHLTSGAIAAFQQSTLTDEELASVAGHIAECEACALCLAQSLPDELAAPPAGFTSEVRRKLYERRDKKRKEFIAYSLRVAISACAALVILWTGVLHFEAPAPRPKRNEGVKVEFLDSITTNLKLFSDQIMNWEVIKNEKTQ